MPHAAVAPLHAERARDRRRNSSDGDGGDHSNSDEGDEGDEGTAEEVSEEDDLARGSGGLEDARVVARLQADLDTAKEEAGEAKAVAAGLRGELHRFMEANRKLEAQMHAILQGDPRWKAAGRGAAAAAAGEGGASGKAGDSEAGSAPPQPAPSLGGEGGSAQGGAQVDAPTSTPTRDWKVDGLEVSQRMSMYTEMLLQNYMAASTTMRDEIQVGGMGG